ncbi:50S ribosomal protein L23 [Candidatus Roizmanbacteria bacterium RIFCSPLOWO2_01_FULL_42_14]|uniref:Large ribosomal subunit protein uL23 n=4 Tax=Candidatus Roizmaniibacteriota TaxID=1752723 RepID=A0A1F7JUX8_9BACT|nr:MAG: 50S ribosomal protein L23 [Candidatus Roizmanbacteria bacterium RIFCSPHIGHO2_02_FULL_43_11]OGK38597.1 MAG: 50S ribosomal protein L23 [Candidatus Roizmanbacteria bacterium RIFCSPHIGHO2_12_FULL_42_10]OGK52190.1 MAG: 50S ribosomal protein L23 [Candidatus Roizmanbacteria bacterium RIFCSPLOWO2_01_FULL_42_14]OGK59423.1 MAG: 50S ribosomal protein L23 [Candidatus Roizmanbacteria bacterium RIFCSPLOWO2_02_FULL_43_10]
MKIQDVLKKPVITEKAMSKGPMLGYMFDVNLRANKHDIKDAVEKIFKVEVKEVNTSVRKGKTRRTGRKMKPKELSDVKKAYVVLKKGSIDIVPKT